MVIVTVWTARDVALLKQAMGLTQRGFADRLGMDPRTVRRWDRGEPIGPTGQEYLGGLLAKASPAQLEYFAGLRSSGEDDDMKRRTLFGAAAVGAVAATVAPAVSVPRLAAGAGRADAVSVGALRTSLHAAMTLDDQLGSAAADGLAQVQTALTEALLRDCPSEHRQPLMVLRAEWVGLSGCLAFDRGDHAQAASLYDDALELAHSAEDSDLAAYMLCHQAQLAAWQDRHRIAMDRAVAAQSWVRTSRDARLRGYVSMRVALAAAQVSHEREARAALDDAAHAVGALGPCAPDESRAYHTDAEMLSAYRGAVLAALGRHAEGAAVLRAAAAEMPSPRDEAVTLLESADASIRAGDIDEAAAAVGTAADRCTRNRSPRLAADVVRRRHELAPWASTSAVRALDSTLGDLVRSA